MRGFAINHGHAVWRSKAEDISRLATSMFEVRSIVLGLRKLGVVFTHVNAYLEVLKMLLPIELGNKRKYADLHPEIITPILAVLMKVLDGEEKERLKQTKELPLVSFHNMFFSYYAGVTSKIAPLNNESCEEILRQHLGMGSVSGT